MNRASGGKMGGGGNEGKRVGRKGPESTLKNSDFGTPMILVLLSGLPNLLFG